MTTRENSKLNNLEILLKNVISELKHSFLRRPEDSLSIKEAAQQYPTSNSALAKMCSNREIEHFRGEGETAKIYIRRQTLEDYFYSEKRKQLAIKN